jgi:hypothetical protein
MEGSNHLKCKLSDVPHRKIGRKQEAIHVKSKKQVARTNVGRQAAYMARNRSALLKAGQEVLAEIGLGATVEELAEHAQVSATTIYKYFETKDQLFSAALRQMWEDWVVWSYNGSQPGTSLESFLFSSRKLFWVKQTHPTFAKVLHNTMTNSAFVMRAVESSGIAVFRDLADRGLVKSDDFEKRIILYGNCLAGLMISVHVEERISPQEAETAWGIALSIWGISESKAKKMISVPLTFPPVKKIL